MSNNIPLKKGNIQYLIFALIAVGIVAFFLLRQSPKQEPADSSVSAVDAYMADIKKIKVNFGFLNNPEFQNLESFEEMRIYQDAKGVSSSTVFAWNEVPGAQIYVFEIIGLLTDQVNGTSTALWKYNKELVPSAAYSWRVKACDLDLKNCGAWVNRVFTTQPLFEAPVVLAPSSGEEIIIGRENPFIAY